MKNRDGFVSNSSTASFIIECMKDFPRDGKKLITDKEIKKLEDYGFWKSWVAYPEQIDYSEYKTNPLQGDDFYTYAYVVTCNELDTIGWLVENNIPFTADCHYGQYSIIFERDSIYVNVFKNLGKCAQMHCAGCHPETTKCFEKIPIDKIEDGYHI
jgi:hypothetical protein